MTSQRRSARINITLSPVLLATVDEFGIKYGLSRSGVIQWALRASFKSQDFALVAGNELGVNDQFSLTIQENQPLLIFGQAYERDKPFIEYAAGCIDGAEMAKNLLIYEQYERQW